MTRPTVRPTQIVVVESLVIAGYIGWRVFSWYQDNDRRNNDAATRAVLAQNPQLAYPPQQPRQAPPPRYQPAPQQPQMYYTNPGQPR